MNYPSDMEKSPFDLEYQFGLFLQQMYPGTAILLPVKQLKQIKDAFMAGMGQMLNIVNLDVTALQEDEIEPVMNHMSQQVHNYWQKAQGREN